jgi:argininosuccinate lyase
VLVALSGAYESIDFHEEKAAAAANDELLTAIDIAELLVEKGLPFRRAHEQVGQLVAEVVSTGRSLYEVAVAHDLPVSSVMFAKGQSLRARRSPGASGPDAREAQNRWIADEVARLTARTNSLPE